MVSEQGPGDDRAGLGGGAIASISGVALLVVFVVQNTEDVKLDFLFWDFTWPLWLLTIVSALLGALVFFGLGVMSSAYAPVGPCLAVVMPRTLVGRYSSDASWDSVSVATSVEPNSAAVRAAARSCCG